LGVYFGNNKEDCEKLNWENKIDKMNTLFFSWGKRNLTILEKIMIIKALVIPIFTFVEDPKVSISLNAIYISFLEVQNKVVSSASCDILML
jgi:hypothetical protein